MRDMTQDQHYIDIHEALERIKDKVKYYNSNEHKLNEVERKRLIELQERVKYYNRKFEYIEEWYGIML